jgi:hypothetical protein
MNCSALVWRYTILMGYYVQGHLQCLFIYQVW